MDAVAGRASLQHLAVLWISLSLGPLGRDFGLGVLRR